MATITRTTTSATTRAISLHSRDSEPTLDQTPEGLPEESSILNNLRPVTQRRQQIILLSAFIVCCVTIGLNQSYGVLQTAYQEPETTLLVPEQTDKTALIAFVGTLGYGLTWAGSVVVNPLMTRVSNQAYLAVPGVVLMSIGLGLASFATQVWHLVLSQGLLFGIGSSFLYFPFLSVTPEYFQARRGIAMGFVLSGAGVGAVILSPTIRALISSFGIRWTLRALALGNLVISGPLAFKAPPSRLVGRRATHVDWRTAKKPSFICSAIASVLQSCGNLIPLTFLSDYTVVLGFSAAFGAILIAIQSGINATSRIILGFAGDAIGRQNMLILAVTGAALAVPALWLSSAINANQTLWLVFVVVYGIVAGAFNALWPTTISDVFGIQNYASVNGAMYFFRGLGSLFTGPIAGALLGSRQQQDYLKIVYLDAALLFGAAVCVVGVRYFDAREKGYWKIKA